MFHSADGVLSILKMYFVVQIEIPVNDNNGLNTHFMTLHPCFRKMAFEHRIYMKECKYFSNLQNFTRFHSVTLVSRLSTSSQSTASRNVLIMIVQNVRLRYLEAERLPPSKTNESFQLQSIFILLLYCKAAFLLMNISCRPLHCHLL